MRISDWSSDVCSSDLAWPFGSDRHEDPPFRVAGGAAFDVGAHAAAAGQHQGQEEKGEPEAPPAHGQSIQPRRSEEHTSELQSLMRISYAVFCLKKKKNKKLIITHTNKQTHNRKLMHQQRK